MTVYGDAPGSLRGGQKLLPLSYSLFQVLLAKVHDPRDQIGTNLDVYFIFLHLTRQSVYASDTGFEGQLDLVNSTLRYLGPDTDKLKLTVSFETESRLHVKITDLMGKRWQVPESLLPRYESLG